MPVKEFNEAIAELDAPAREFEALVDALSARSPDGRIIFTEQLMRSLAREGLEIIKYHAARGSLKAAMYLVDRCLGSPDQPFRDQVTGMSREQAESALFDEFKKQGFTDDVARGLVVAARQLPATDNVA